jgi:hypothetical protein
MAETADTSGRADLDAAGVATGGVDLEAFITRCHEKGLLPGHVTVEQARGMRDRLRDHQRALSEYSPQPLPVAVHLFPAQQSAGGPVARLEGNGSRGAAPGDARAGDAPVHDAGAERGRAGPGAVARDGRGAEG